MGTLNILVIYDRWEEPEEQGAVAAADKAPLTRTLDKKEVEDEVAEALGKLGHQATLHELDGALKSLHALARTDCDLVFNLAESFAGNDTADYCIAAYLELIDKRFTGSGSHGLLYAQDTPFTGGARGFNRGLIFTRTGELVASTAQEGMIRIRRDAAKR